MKICTSCHKLKPPTDYYPRRKNGKSSGGKCKLCVSKRAMVRGKAKESRRRRHINRWKVSKGCSNCGYNESAVALDLHHINESTKDGDVGYYMTSRLSKLFNEIRKCVILCANCHRRHHAGEI